MEQYRYYRPIDASAAKLVNTYLALYDATGDALDLAKAKALGDSIVNLQEDDGRIPTHWGKNPKREHDWINCMFGSATALENLARHAEVK